jgi:hypothetical protein
MGPDTFNLRWSDQQCHGGKWGLEKTGPDSVNCCHGTAQLTSLNEM